MQNPEFSPPVEHPDGGNNAQVVAVEELIPNIKPVSETKRTWFPGIENDNTYANDLLRTVESKPEFLKSLLGLYSPQLCCGIE